MPNSLQLNLFGDYIALDTDPPTTEVTNAKPLVQMAKTHWKENLPGYYQKLQKEGTLELGKRQRRC